MTRRMRATPLAALLLAAPVQAQDGLRAACEDAPADAAFCRTVALGAEALLPVLVVAAEGGSPVPGTASTLGMRLTSMPRWTLGGRTTLAWANAPDLRVRGGGNTLQLMPAAFGIDGSVGLLPGWSPLPTVGGVASLDVLFGLSIVPLLATDQYGGVGGWSWAAGARVGALRESFTLPGVSLSAMYRQLRNVSLGDAELEDADSYIETDLSVLSARFAASKAILLLNLTGGVGYDVIIGDVHFGYDASTGPVRLTADAARMERVTFFGELSYTLMVLNFVLAGGWQQGPDPIDDGVEGDDYAADGSFYASAVMRLSI